MADVMIEVDGATQKSGQAVRGVRLALGGIRKRPVGIRLPFEGHQNERNGFIEFAQDLGFGRLAGLAELQVAVANVAGIGNARAEVITEIAGQVEHEVADTVAVGKGIAPKLALRQRVGPLVEIRSALAKFVRERSRKCIA